MNTQILWASLDQSLEAIAALEDDNVDKAQAHALVASALASALGDPGASRGGSVRRADERDAAVAEWIDAIQILGYVHPLPPDAAEAPARPAPPPEKPRGQARR